MSTLLKSNGRLLRAMLIFAMSMGAIPGQAHVVLKDNTATVGTYFVATFRVPHGCGTSPTVALRVTIPPEVLIAKPMPKPGWCISLVDELLPRPVKGPHGTLAGRLVEITWSGGPLPGEHFDEFSILVFPPARAGPLYFPTVQVCETGEIGWVDVPPEGKTLRDMPFPAPAITVVPEPATNERKE